MQVTAAIITFNEEANIGDAIGSVSWADEILVVDSESTDRTREIAEQMGASVISRPWPGFSAQKQFAVDQAQHDMIFSLDADERVSPALADEIGKVLAGGRSADGYRIPRLSYYMGRAIRHGGWYPDHQLRLFDRRKGRWKNLLIHESFAMDKGARVEALAGDILHFSVKSAGYHHRMIGERYAPLAAKQAFDQGKRTSFPRIALSGPAAFLRTYVLKLGVLDGLPGLAIAWFAAHHAFLKQIMLMEMQQQHEADPGADTPDNH
jgi:glycosyltransferase involved in cell wall biosynthesis